MLRLPPPENNNATKVMGLNIYNFSMSFTWNRYPLSISFDWLALANGIYSLWERPREWPESEALKLQMTNFVVWKLLGYNAATPNTMINVMFWGKPDNLTSGKPLMLKTLRLWQYWLISWNPLCETSSFSPHFLHRFHCHHGFALARFPSNLDDQEPHEIL